MGRYYFMKAHQVFMGGDLLLWETNLPTSFFILDHPLGCLQSKKLLIAVTGHPDEVMNRRMVGSSQSYLQKRRSCHRPINAWRFATASARSYRMPDLRTHQIRNRMLSLMRFQTMRYD